MRVDSKADAQRNTNGADDCRSDSGVMVNPNNSIDISNVVHTNFPDNGALPALQPTSLRGGFQGLQRRRVAAQYRPRPRPTVYYFIAKRFFRFP